VAWDPIDVVPRKMLDMCRATLRIALAEVVDVKRKLESAEAEIARRIRADIEEAVMGEKGKQQGQEERTYRLAGVQADDGSVGTLVFTVKPGGNAHAEFEPDAQSAPEAPDQSLPGEQPQAGQLPAEEPAEEPAAPQQLPAQEPPDPAQPQ
jgi:hypothetical protein